jgi:DNA-binding LytR/AlgR family response regulator
MENTIWIRNRYEQAVIDTGDVCYLELTNRKVIVHTYNQTFWEYCSMEEMLRRLSYNSVNSFYRCHHGLVVNLDHIKSLENGIIDLIGGKELLMYRAAWQRTKRMWERCKFGIEHDTRTGEDRRKGPDRRISAGHDRRKIN